MAAVFTDQEIERAKAAMAKPGPLNALALIASGRAVIEISKSGRDVLIVELDGRRVKDPDYPDDPARKCGLAGGWALIPAGMLDEFGCLTKAAHEHLGALSG